MVIRLTGICASILALGCGSDTSVSNAVDAGAGGNAVSSSEIAIDAVSGALNTTRGAAVVWLPPRAPRGVLARVVAALNPIGTAHAAAWTCSGGNLAPAFAGPGSYTWTPPSCSVSLDDESGSSSWSGNFTLVYGASCDTSHEWIDRQAAGCAMTRTTAAGGNTRTIMTLEGTTRTVTHDTNGAGTGWDSTVSPAPTSDGVVVTCGASGCDTGRTLAISGSHLTGMISGTAGTTHFDHTVTTGAGGLTVTGSGVARTVNGTVTVQHNLTKNTATVTLTGVVFGDLGCPFPTGGSVSASFTDGPKAGTTETMTFTAGKCGETSVTVNGSSTPTTLEAPI